MESHMVTALMTQTGLSPQASHALLQSKGWDLASALTTFENIKNSVSLELKSAECERQHSNAADYPRYMEPITCNLNVPMNIPLSVERNGQEKGNEDSNQRSSLLKAGALDITDCKKLTRGISRATDNVILVSRARNEFAMNFPVLHNALNSQCYIETPEYTFTLPDITVYSDDFKKFLEKDLIENSSLIALEQSGRLNWWAANGVCQRLWPLATTGDGNCLLHAASLAMWGFHDRLLTLRGALYNLLTSDPCREALWRRWRWQQSKLNAEANFVYSEEEWSKEWEGIVSMASTEPRKPYRRRSMIDSRSLDDVDTFENATYESLEEIHVLALAHVLRRPIIVIADVMLKDLNGEAMAPIPFGGIYLPLECLPSDCHRSPLLLTYDMAHFSALVVMEKECYGDKNIIVPPAVIPLTDPDNHLLPIQFSIDPGEAFIWGKDDKDPANMKHFVLTERDQLNVLKEYLNVVYVSSQLSPGEEYEIDFSEDEIEKKFIEPEVITDETDGPIFGNNKSKAAKQLQSVAKQFGSIGKSMSKKIKKNIGSITTKMAKGQKKTLSSVNSVTNIAKTKLLCAELRAKRHEYQEEMVRNYLEFAQERFLKSQSDKCKQERERQHFENLKLQEQAYLEGSLNCINPGCDQFGTALTSYMCNECFEKQQNEELLSQTDDLSPRYDTGNSKFYAETDMESHEFIKRMPSVKALNNLDQTLYLSKSTFYNDTRKPCSAMNSYDYWENNPPDYQRNVSPSLNESNVIHRDLRSSNNTYHPNGYEMIMEHPETLANIPENHIRSNIPLQALKVNIPGQASVFSLGNTIGAASPVSPKSNFTKSARNSKPVEKTQSLQHNNENRTTTRSSLGCLGKQSQDEPDISTVTVQTPFGKAKPCKTMNCMFFGSPEMDYYCSKCSKERRIEHNY